MTHSTSQPLEDNISRLHAIDIAEQTAIEGGALRTGNVCIRHDFVDEPTVPPRTFADVKVPMLY